MPRESTTGTTKPAYLRAAVQEICRADLKERCSFVSRPGAPNEEQRLDTIAWRPPCVSHPANLDVGTVFEGVAGDD